MKNPVPVPASSKYNPVVAYQKLMQISVLDGHLETDIFCEFHDLEKDVLYNFLGA